MGFFDNGRLGTWGREQVAKYAWAVVLTILKEAGQIHPDVEGYLRQSRFAAAWAVIRKNSRDEGQLRRQFHGWFDGLKTLKLVRMVNSTSLVILFWIRRLSTDLHQEAAV